MNDYNSISLNILAEGFINREVSDRIVFADC